MFLAIFPSSLLSIIMIFNIGEKTDVTLAALFFSSEAVRLTLGVWSWLLFLSSTFTHGQRDERRKTKKLPREQVFSQNVEAVCVLQDGPALRKRDYKATNSPSSILAHCPHRKNNSIGCMLKHFNMQDNPANVEVFDNVYFSKGRGRWLGIKM